MLRAEFSESTTVVGSFCSRDYKKVMHMVTNLENSYGEREHNCTVLLAEYFTLLCKKTGLRSIDTYF